LVFWGLAICPKQASRVAEASARPNPTEWIPTRQKWRVLMLAHDDVYENLAQRLSKVRKIDVHLM
jgi:hypothetical protein